MYAGSLTSCIMSNPWITSLHIKAAKQVTGVISHITDMSLAGFVPRQPSQICEKLRVSHLTARLEYIASVR